MISKVFQLLMSGFVGMASNSTKCKAHALQACQWRQGGKIGIKREWGRRGRGSRMEARMGRKWGRGRKAVKAVTL